MTSSRSLLVAVAAFCIALFAAALYLQTAREMAPCPLCIVQRYLLTAIAFGCLASALSKRLHKAGVVTCLCLALAGTGAAILHLWMAAVQGPFCDIGPLEDLLDEMPAARLFPLLFKACATCAASVPFHGLSMAQWSLLGFSMIVLSLLRHIARPEPLVPWLA